jgi:hypothetical protein
MPTINPDARMKDIARIAAWMVVLYAGLSVGALFVVPFSLSLISRVIDVAQLLVIAASGIALFRLPHRVVLLSGISILTLSIDAAMRVLFVIGAGRGWPFGTALCASMLLMPIAMTGGWFVLHACVARWKREAELQPLCGGCGFSLQGATWPRCPECGKIASP